MGCHDEIGVLDPHDGLGERLMVPVAFGLRPVLDPHEGLGDLVEAMRLAETGKFSIPMRV